jgi:hypothetical protein
VFWSQRAEQPGSRKVGKGKINLPKSQQTPLPFWGYVLPTQIQFYYYVLHSLINIIPTKETTIPPLFRDPVADGLHGYVPCNCRSIVRGKRPILNRPSTGQVREVLGSRTLLVLQPSLIFPMEVDKFSDSGLYQSY